MRHPIACLHKFDLADVEKMYHINVFELHWLPDWESSDRERNFTSKFMNHPARILDTESEQSTTFHPKTDGEAKRTNIDIES